MLNTQVAQIRHLSQKTPKNQKNSFWPKLREIAGEWKISEGNLFTILHEHLSVRKLYSKRVPRFLTVDQKQERVDDSEHCL